MLRRTLALALIPLLLACGSDDDESGATPTPDAGDAGPGGNTADSGGSGGTAGAGGSGPDGGVTMAPDCDPISVRCGLPFPTDYYLKPDPTGQNPSGLRVEFGATTLPKIIPPSAPVGTPGDRPIPPDIFFDLDGWSVASTPMIHLPGATAEGLPNPSQIAESILPTSNSILLNVETGERVPHWVDLDLLSRIDSQRMLILHPAIILPNASRFIVAFRNVVDASGQPLAPSAGFLALREGTASPEPSLEQRRAHYDDIFAQLQTAGIAKDDLQIAWDFTTGTKEGITGPMVELRDAALTAVGQDGPNYVVSNVEVAPNSYLKTRVTLTADMPVFITDASHDPATPPAELNRDASGALVQNGTMPVDILVGIPNTVDDLAVTHGVLQNGHGLLGSKEEGQNGYLARAAGDGWITIAIDLYGFAGDDLFTVLGMLRGAPEQMRTLISRQIQGMVNQLVAMRLFKGRIARDGIADPAGGMLLEAGKIDPSLLAYRGDSQGGIMGGTYMSVSTDVTRGLLGETGTPYSLLLNRSVDSVIYADFIREAYPWEEDPTQADEIGVQIFWALLQLHWDRSEPSGFVRHMRGSDLLPNTPSHNVILDVALGDHQVTTLGAHIMARAIDAKLLRSNDPAQPVIRDVWGVTQADAPLVNDSALIEWDFGLAPEPLTNLPPTDGCDPHDRVRAIDSSFPLQDTFFRTGRIEQLCNGVCNCDDTTSGDSPDEEPGCLATCLDQCDVATCTP